jgi:hypothetical protein
MTAGELRRAPALRAAGGLARAVLTAVPAGLTRVRRNPPSEPVGLAVLAGLCLVALLLFVAGGPVWSPAAALSVPLILGGLLLTRDSFRWLVLLVAVCLLFEVVAIGFGLDGVRPAAVVVTALTAAIAYEFTRSREETGLSGASGEGVLLELRHRLEQQGELPHLPPGWCADAVVRPAGGGPFAGDFVVSSLSRDGRTLELALVDVSGKGVAAGTRALMLSGALGGLLGSVPPDQFLAAANVYLDRQEWGEGFATAVHLVLDLMDGSYLVESAAGG